MKIRSFTISLLVFVIFGANLTSCGAVPAAPTLTPLPTETFTPAPAATATHTPTETPAPTEYTQESNGIIVSSPWPELKLKKENTAQINTYILETLSLINWQTVEKVIKDHNDGKRIPLVSDGKIYPKAWEAWIDYLEQNNWILKYADYPEFLIMTGEGGDWLTIKLVSVGQDIDLSKFNLEFINKDNYFKALTAKDPDIEDIKIYNRSLLLIPDVPMGLYIRASMGVRTQNNSDLGIITFSIMNKKEMSGTGFPLEGEEFTDAQSEINDEIMRMFIYAFRSQQILIPTEATKNNYGSTFARAFGDDKLMNFRLSTAGTGGNHPLWKQFLTNPDGALTDLSLTDLKPLSDISVQIFEYLK